MSAPATLINVQSAGYPIPRWARHQGDLVAYYCEDRARMGSRSNFSSILAMLEGGTGATKTRDGELEEDPQRALEDVLNRPAIKAAAHSRRVSAALRELSAAQNWVLRATYGHERQIGMEAFGMLAALVAFGPEAVKLHARAHAGITTHAWLVGISDRIVGRLDRDTGCRSRPSAKESDRKLVVKLETAARATLDEALSAYVKRVRRFT